MPVFARLGALMSPRILVLELFMTTASLSIPMPGQRLLRPILTGGAIAGALDLTSAFLTYGANVPRVIAAGLLGREVIHDGLFAWICGVFLHFFIAFSAATVYCLAGRKLGFLSQHWLVCGMFYGIAVYLVMNLVVLPLSALHAVGPYQLRGLIQGIVVHMFLIGAPIAFSLRKLSS
jgi:hypothetical protein